MIPVPPSLRRIAEEIDGWLDLECPERALQRIDELIDSDAGHRAGLAMRIRAYVALARYREALADITALRDGADIDEWLDLCEAWCRKRIDDLPGAIASMERLVRRDGQSSIGHYNLGCYLALAGDRDRAIDEVTIACGLDENLRDTARDEPDLDGLRADPRFRALLRPERADEDAGASDDD